MLEDKRLIPADSIGLNVSNGYIAQTSEGQFDCEIALDRERGGKKSGLRMIKFLEVSPELPANNPNHRTGQLQSLTSFFLFFFSNVLHFAEGGIISGEDFRIAITESTRDGGKKNLLPTLIADQIREQN